MRAFEVSRNGEVLCVAGTPNAEVLAVDVSGDVEGPEPARLSINGMNGLPENRASHARWEETLALSAGDEITIAFVEVTSAFPAKEEIAADSKQHLGEQRWFEEQILGCKSPPPPKRRVLSDLRFSLLINGETVIEAALDETREFISFSQLWNKWHPDRCRVSLRSASGREAFECLAAKEWVRRTLILGDRVTVRIDA